MAAKLRAHRFSTSLWHIRGRLGHWPLTHEMGRRKGRYGLATMCIGVGQGIAAVIERL